MGVHLFIAVQLWTAAATKSILLKDPFQEEDDVPYSPGDPASPYRYQSVPFVPPYPWTFVPAGDEPGDTITTTQKKSSILEVADPFFFTVNQTIFGTFDHCKKLTETEPFDVCVGCSLRVEYEARCEQLNVEDHPFDDAVTNPNADLRLGFCSVELFDLETATFNVFAITNEVVYAFYERLPSLLQDVDIDPPDPEGWATCPLEVAPPEDIILDFAPPGVYCPRFYSYTTAKKVYEKTHPNERLKMAIELTRYEDRSEMTWYLKFPSKDDRSRYERKWTEVLRVPKMGLLPEDEPKLGVLCERNGDPDDEAANTLDISSIRVGFNLLNAHDFGDIVKITDLLEDPSMNRRDVMERTNLGLQKVSSLRNLYTYPTNFVDDDSRFEHRMFGAGAALEMEDVKVIFDDGLPDDKDDDKDEDEDEWDDRRDSASYKVPYSADDLDEKGYVIMPGGRY